MLEIMLRTLRLEAGGGPERMDPLLRELMVTALQRSQDERDRDNLTVPRYRYPMHHIQHIFRCDSVCRIAHVTH